MAISGQQVIGVGLQNESTGSDSLYTAFNKTRTNFATLFANASPFTTFTGGTGLDVIANANTVSILNTGVTSLSAGPGIVLNQSNGAVEVSAEVLGGTVTSVGLTSTSLTVANSPIIASGNIQVDLPIIANIAGSYVLPTVTVDHHGRVTNIAATANVGTVTNVGITAGAGIAIIGSPITTSGEIQVTNTGVTGLVAGTGISLDGATGNVTITFSATSIDTANTVIANAQPNITSVGSLSSLTVVGNLNGGNLVTANYFSGDGSALSNVTALPTLDSLNIVASDEVTALVVNPTLFRMRMPHAFTLSAIKASLSIEQTSGLLFTVDVKVNTVSILSTLITFNNGTKTTVGAVTPAVISAPALANDDEITISVTQVGSGTAAGLKVYLIGYK